MQSLTSFIAEHRITAEAEYQGQHSETHETSWGSKQTFYQDDWKVTLKHRRKQLTVDFHMGQGHQQAEPTAHDVLSCLLMDASGYDSARDFEDWASEYGYDTDSRKAEQTYNTLIKQTRRLKQFMGELWEDVNLTDWDK